MRAQEQTVTKYHWEGVRDYLLYYLHKGGFIEGEFPPEVVINVKAERELFYVICEPDRPIAWLYLGHFEDWHAWEVLQVFVLPECRGRGLAKKLYEGAINRDNLMIASGKSQTKYSQAIWKSFVREERFNLYAVDFWELDIGYDVYWDEDEGAIQCELPIYFIGTKQERDVRLIATRKIR